MRAGGSAPRGSAPGSGGGQASARAARPQVIRTTYVHLTSPAERMRLKTGYICTNGALASPCWEGSLERS